MNTMTDYQAGSSEYVDVAGGRIAYQVVGHGPLVVLSPGLGDIRSTFRFLAPLIADAGYRVASVDLRGHGDSSTGWSSYSRTDTADDLIEVIRKLGDPATIVGQSFSGGSAIIAAAMHPDLVSAIVGIDPGARPPSISMGALFHNANHRRALILLIELLIAGRVKPWLKYLDLAYPGHKPADWDTWLTALAANLREPGRMKAVQKMSQSKPFDSAAQMANVKCPALVIMGRNDPDWPDPQAEAAAITGLLPAGLGRYEMIDNAGHYPHAQYPQQVADVLLPFLAKGTHA